MKKLTLNKETIANLKNDQASGIMGGVTGVCPVSNFSQVDPKCYTDCVMYCIYTDACVPTESICC